MPALRVTCQHCQRTTVVDSDKLPDQPVSFRCPGCQNKILVDKRKLQAGADADRSTGPLVTTPESPLEMALPPGETIPPGFLIAEDAEAGAQVRRTLEPYDCTLEPFADAAAARERVLQEPPPLLVYVADAVSKPPYAPLEPLVTLPPRERRRTFAVLVASNVKTLDGNLAFLYQVNLLLNRQHVVQAPGILYAALRSHQRLYQPFLAALRE